MSIAAFDSEKYAKILNKKKKADKSTLLLMKGAKKHSTTYQYICLLVLK